MRNINREKAEKEVDDFMKQNKNAYPSDIADALNLDFDLVMEIVKDLVKAGRLK